MLKLIECDSMATPKRKNYMADFETTTNPDDCRVWAWGCMEIYDEATYQENNTIDSFMAFVKTCNGNIYFHNLRFDGEFIINWLLHHGYTVGDEGKVKTFNATISSMGQWYIIDIIFGYKYGKAVHTVIYDSYKKLPFPVSAIGKAFNLDFEKIKEDQEFYTRKRKIGHKITEEEHTYLMHDILVVAKALSIQFQHGDLKITNGSDALADYKSMMGKKQWKYYFPVFDLDTDKKIRKFYRGGFTWVNPKFQNKDLKHGIVFDVNSLYPSQMYHRLLPYGIPLFFNGKYQNDKDYPLYLQYMICSFEIKPNHIPTIQLKGKKFFFKETEYLDSSDGNRVELFVTNIDLELIKKHYDLYDVEYVWGFKFKGKQGLFKGYIDKYMKMKMENEGALKQLAKLKLNSLYGKFATSPDITGKVPYLKEDGSCGYRKGDEDYREPIYTPMGVFITSWARYTTITSAQKCYDRIIYCDTDSMHLIGTSVPDAIKEIVDPKLLGYWKHESTWKNGRFLRQKTYIEEICLKFKRDEQGNKILKDGKEVTISAGIDDAELTKWNIKCAGMPDSVKEKMNWGNFKLGFSSMGKLLPKHVKGGLVLNDSPFTIK